LTTIESCSIHCYPKLGKNLPPDCGKQPILASFGQDTIRKVVVEMSV